MTGTVVVKLGGSAITDKSKACTPRLGLIHQSVDAIAAHPGPLVLLHGGGSYAHPFITVAMKKNRFRGKSQVESVSEVELNLDQLTRIVGVALLLRHRAFVPFRPMSFLTLKDGDIGSSFLRPLTQALRFGMIPLIHGDLAMDESGGCGIVSADRMASLLGEKMEVSRVLFGCDVDGIHDRNPRTKGAKLVREVDRRNSRTVLKGLKASPGDMTGGMQGKFLEALRLAKRGVESYIFNLNEPSNLKNLLDGSTSIGTRFVSWKR